MLVLSRRPGQRVQLPTLGISIQVLQTARNAVRLGIQAPHDVTVLREELLPADLAAPPPAAKAARWSHEQRGRLNTAAMALHLVEKQLQAGRWGDAEASLREAQQALEALDQAPPPRPQEARPAELGALLVEDDCNEGELLAGYLRMSGIRTDTVHDGEEALEFLSSHKRPDFVLLDMHLPRRDGLSTLSAIRQNEAMRQVRVFAVTGSTPEELGVGAGMGGLDGWFRKPLNPARIVEAMLAAVPNN